MKIGCLHAHYSNISYIEQAAAPIGLELIHFVGKKEQYAHAVSSELNHLLKSDRHTALSVVQLSMVEAAERTEHERGISIGNPLRTLTAYLHALFAGST